MFVLVRVENNRHSCVVHGTETALDSSLRSVGENVPGVISSYSTYPDFGDDGESPEEEIEISLTLIQLVVPPSPP